MHNHPKIKIREANVHEFPKIGAFQHVIMKNDPLFQMKFSNVDFEDWLQYKWLGKRQEAVLKGDAAIFIAEGQDDREILGVVGWLKIKSHDLASPGDQSVPKGEDLKNILDVKEAYAETWHREVTESEGDFLRESSVAYDIPDLLSRLSLFPVIQPLAVSEKHQRRGIGKALVNHILGIGEELEHKVAVSALSGQQSAPKCESVFH